jgi:uncharacterized membrane protein (DUF441 family)
MSVRTAVILLACTVVILTATLAGAGAGYLARRDHASYPEALTHAAVAFSGTVTLAAVVATALASLM